MSGVQDRFDPEKLLSDEIIVDKLDAARRQLDSAVAMFFYEWDVVSQHTLIGAAHGILYDLAKQQGVGGSIKDSPLVGPEARGEFIKAINLPQNFFKHADRDSRTKLVFRYSVSHFYLFDAVRLFVLLGGSTTRKMKVFLMWFQLRYPDLLCFQPAEEDLQMIRESATDPEVFRALARTLLDDPRNRNDIDISHQLANGAVAPARDAEKIIPCGPGFYSIIVDDPMNLPEAFGSILAQRATPLLYIGVASKSLQERLVRQDLRHKRPSTFFRGIGATLGFRPPRGSLIGKRNQNNYRFDRADTKEIIAWIDKHTSVRYIEVDPSQRPGAEALAISQHRPLLNKHHNPDAVSVLEDLREECRRIALTPPDGTD